MSNTTKFILASQSPRRKEILQSFGINHEVVKPTVDEMDLDKISSATKLAEENSRLKCEEVAKKYEKLAGEYVIVGCDTVASYNDKIIGKPESAADAKQILRMLSGTVHEVVSGLTVIKFPENSRITTHEITKIQMLEMTDEDIDAYVNSGEAHGKAGAYAIQETGDRFVKIIAGSFYNVVGLPIEKLLEILAQLNVAVELS